MPGSRFDFSSHPLIGGSSQSALLADAIAHAARQLAAPEPPEAVSPTVEAARAMGLAEFVREAWHVIEPGTEYHHNWHIDAVCMHLEAVTAGRIRRLLINIPPGMMKSLLVAVFWPAWVWVKRPEWRAVFGSYSLDLSQRDSVRCRDVLQSDWYRDTFRPSWSLAGDQNVKSYFRNTRKGERLAISVTGKGTGFRGDCTVFDDPLKADEAYSEAARETAWRWWGKTMSSRLNDMRTGARVGIMQRLHEEDPAGRIIERGGYELLILPSEFEPARRATTSIGWSDPRTSPGELLFPIMFPADVLEEAKVDLGSDGYAGQHQQRPVAAEGKIVKDAWWRYYDVLPPVFETVVMSWDMAFKGEDSDADYVVGQVWARLGADLYLLDQVRARLEFTETRKAVQYMAAKWPAASAKYVEDKANGPAIISSLRRTVPGIIAVEPDGDKISRTRAAAPFIEAGNVWLPGPDQATRILTDWRRAMADGSLFVTDEELQPQRWLPSKVLVADWVGRFVYEFGVFPKGANDDQVDAGTQAIRRLMASVGQRGGITAPLAPGSSAPDLPNTSDLISRRF